MTTDTGSNRSKRNSRVAKSTNHSLLPQISHLPEIIEAGNATFKVMPKKKKGTFASECKERLAKVIRSCDGNDNEKKMLKRMLYDLTEENRLKQKGFAAVYDILHSL